MYVKSMKKRKNKKTELVKFKQTNLNQSETAKNLQMVYVTLVGQFAVE